MSAGVTLTLPGPSVTATVTWDDVRAYLRAEGWTWRGQSGGVELWRLGDVADMASVRTAYVGAFPSEGAGERMIAAVSWLAHLAAISPGELLTRIAGMHDRTELRARLVAELRAAGDEMGAEACAGMYDVRSNAVATVARSRKLLSAALLRDLGIVDEEVSGG